MKKRGKLFVFAMMLVLALVSITACGSDDQEDQDITEDGEDTADTDSQDKGDASGDFDGQFVVGGFGPITGESASYGTSVMHASRIAVEEINAAGGVQVGDQTLELVHTFEDDQASADVAMSAYNKLMDDGAQVIVGGVTSGSHMGVVDLAYEDNILLLSPSVTVENGIEYPNAFRTCFTDSMQANIMAEYALSTGAKEIGVIYNQSDPYSTGIMQVFVDRIEESDSEIVAQEAFVEGDTDMKTQLTTIKNSGAEIVFVPTYYQAASYITQQADEIGMEVPFIGTDGWDGILEVTVDPDIIEGCIFQTPFAYNDPSPDVQAFVEKFEEETGEVPDQFGANAYDAVYIIKAALEQAGSVESQDIIDAMHEIEYDGITGTISFNEDGEPDKEVKLVEIVDGEYKIFTLE